MQLFVLAATLSIAVPPPDDVRVQGLLDGSFCQIVRAQQELTVIAEQLLVPQEWRQEREWRAIGIYGSLDFNTVGVLAALITPLAHAAIPVFALSTYSTDYVLVRSDHLDRALQTLEEHGHTITPQSQFER